ncbi:MAG: tryptophan 2,3-dioxygenase family protein [Oligoflexia bacterium]|nr:tryptophan 2,3-dioxygenase family protein [Oligoflexia bacterium]
MPDEKKSRPSGCPMHAAPTLLGEGELSYNDYLKVPELLSLQLPQSNPAHHDEMLFIIIHQAYELWFKLVLHEMESAIRFMAKDKILLAHHFIHRINSIMKLLVQQIHILETMTPIDFLAFRDRLKPASGFQSAQFREVEFVAGLKDPSYMKYFRERPEYLALLQRRFEGPDLRSTYYALLRRQGFAIPENAAEREAKGDDTLAGPMIQALLPLYREPSKNSQVYILSEALVEFDQQLSFWREHHVRVVERVIGAKQGTGGSSGVEYLRSTTIKRCFPYLWQVRTHLEDGV